MSRPLFCSTHRHRDTRAPFPIIKSQPAADDSPIAMPTMAKAADTQPSPQGDHRVTTPWLWFRRSAPLPPSPLPLSGSLGPPPRSKTSSHSLHTTNDDGFFGRIKRPLAQALVTRRPVAGDDLPRGFFGRRARSPLAKGKGPETTLSYVRRRLSIGGRPPVAAGEAADGDPPAAGTGAVEAGAEGEKEAEAEPPAEVEARGHRRRPSRGLLVGSTCACSRAGWT